ncbi:Unknown protein DS12 from 2D-PAGE of leaf Flags: Precursor [Monoraphidium neglectum]|uniref:ACT domain-containing protein n=1 Tax=Monoraphidium neglectum TaxID=145388 RepID=A0A0D2M6L6_9CHLO|nr:Unknown protein DS12 from 2D-PAGE of leaf Flags: Precursor [Monoraphidium neglectum]KIY99044.1 Unknown protein DS12 from 2D-PAGE of leaf Flags: Precursor [Monoraphidium neglectum]|eukprot:XP_013898064.1 Unknown protein DS12 from 2D-PAGE of leaf Flags: Precursor [Monoraphidium neglectum]
MSICSITGIVCPGVSKSRAAGRPIGLAPRVVRAAVSTNGAPTAAPDAAIPKPVVKIDNIRDPFATVVTVEFGDRLGELLDTITSLKNLGLNIRRAKLDGAPGRKSNTFYITDATTSEKITRSAQIEEIRMTIINNLLYYHPESSEALAAGQPARSSSRDSTSPLGPKARSVVQTTIEVAEADNGSCSVCKISTRDRPGLLVDVVSVLKDINVNVVSAEIDTFGDEARDELFITYHGEPLPGPMVQLVTNALQYYLSLAEVEKEESY